MSSTVYPKKGAYSFTDEEMKSMDTEKIEKYLYQIAMWSEWGEVVRTYSLNKRAHRAKITKSDDTALHVAVSDGQEKHVEELVKLMNVEDLQIRNKQGNTPLHIAAWMGNETMCLSIAKDHPSLISAPNVDNEGQTPLFLAAAYGKKDAFLRMHYIYASTLEGYDHWKRYSYCRRNEGDTMLHVAIAREHFDLAFQIIHLYADLVNYSNAQCYTPLHLLATKPSAFKSSSHLGRFQRIIYYFINVNELKPEPCDPSNEGMIKTFEEEKNPNYPETYETCVNFIRLFRETILSVIKNVVQASQRQRGEKKSADPENQPTPNTSNSGLKSNDLGQGHQKFPGNYSTCFEFIKLLSKTVLIVLGLGKKATMHGLGSTQIRKIREKKEKHKWSVQIMNELLKRVGTYECEDSSLNPQALEYNDETKPYKLVDGRAVFALPESDGEQEAEKPNNGKEKIPEGSSAEETEKKTLEMGKLEAAFFIAAKNGVTDKVEKIIEIFPVATEKKILEMGEMETAFLVAAKHGVTEMVEKILEIFPMAIRDTNAEGKNVVLLAAENRQLFVFQLLLERNIPLKDNMFSKVDNAGNSALHLAATAMLEAKHPCSNLGPFVQLLWEIKWFEFVKDSMAPHFFAPYNKKNQTARDIFRESHAKLVKDGEDWLSKFSQNCLVTGGIVSTVAFATATAVPGGTIEATGTPILENQVAFEVFAISSLIALCSSVTSMAIYLSIILISQFPEGGLFGNELPIKGLVGLTMLLMSIISMVVSFCGGHFFMLKDKLKHFALPVYLMACMPLAFYSILQVPLYCSLICLNFKQVPYFYRNPEATE